MYDTVKALPYIRQGLKLASKDPFYTGLGHFYLGRTYFDYDVDKAIDEFKIANAQFEKFKSKAAYILLSRSWGNIATLDQRKSDKKSYIDILLHKAIPLAVQGGDSIRVAVNYMNVALPFTDLKEYKTAIYYYLKANDIFKRLNPLDLRRSDIFVNMAKTYILSGNLPEAKNWLDSAAVFQRLDPNSIYALSFYSIQSMYYVDTKQSDLAAKSIENGLALATKLNSKADARQLLYQKALLYRQKKDYSSVIATLQQLLKGDYPITNTDKKQILYFLAVTEATTKNMSAAYKWLLEYSTLSDSLNKQKIDVEIASLEAKYNYAEKEKQLLLLESKANHQRFITWLTLICLLIAIIFFIYLNKQRKNKAEQALISLKQTQKIALTQALLQGEEKERTRLARDLHDGLGGMLAGVKINLSNALQENTSTEIDRVVSQLDDSVTELRRIARNMMPEALLRSGLETALSDLCQSLTSEKLKMEFSFMNIRKSIPLQTQIIIYRIIQELLANVVKHSSATEVFVQCSQNESLFFITVEDNGKGIDPEQEGRYRGLGMENIQSRVDFLNGKIEVHSELGNGTITNIEIKINDTQ